jgi:hypothetical protein
LCYTVLAEAGSIKINDPGLMDECRLYISDCVVTGGAAGNVIERNRFVHDSLNEDDETAFSNPSPGSGGVTRETPQQLRMRFLGDIKRAGTAVTSEDYEELTMRTPGFCIHKVKAVFDSNRNIMSVAVKPHAAENFPKLSPLQITRIEKWLGKRRMITTDIELRQPIYVPVDVQATVYVKSYFEDVTAKIEKYIRESLDGISSGVPFGTTVSYHKLFRGFEELDYVDSLYELVISTRDRHNARSLGTDIKLNNDALYYAGQISLEAITKR